MGFRCGIIGLPNAGKTTIFNALTANQASCAPYPFCTIDPNTGTAEVPDSRLERLIKVFSPREVIRAVLIFVDIAGLVKNASKGEGLGNQFLSHIRAVDAVAQVVRCFDREDVPHVNNIIDPVIDLEVVETELILADLEMVERSVEHLRKAAKSGDPEILKKLEEHKGVALYLQRGIPLREAPLEKEQSKAALEMTLLTIKPLLLVANINYEGSPEQQARLEALKEIAQRKRLQICEIDGEIEAELATMTAKEKKEFAAELGVVADGLEKIIGLGYEALDLITFYTIVGDKIGSWTVSRGTTAQEAAGKIHSDMQKGFIKAEVIEFDRLMEAGSESVARDKGLIRIEGRDYIVKDGEVFRFKFNI